jgi:hypothetical protein
VTERSLEWSPSGVVRIGVEGLEFAPSTTADVGTGLGEARAYQGQLAASLESLIMVQGGPAESRAGLEQAMGEPVEALIEQHIEMLEMVTELIGEVEAAVRAGGL